MRCRQCLAEHDADLRFCESCSAKRARLRPSCAPAEAALANAAALIERTGARTRLLQPAMQGCEDIGAPALVYEWFTEGLEARNLQDAKALLEELR